jgi:hypothetical protein
MRLNVVSLHRNVYEYSSSKMLYYVHCTATKTLVYVVNGNSFNSFLISKFV